MAKLAFDFSRYNSGDVRMPLPKRLWLIWEISGLQALVAYRLDQWARGHAHPLAWAMRPCAAILRALSRRCLGIAIDPRAQIEGGLYIGHCGSFYVGPSQIGKFCTINQHAHVGAPEGPPVRIADGVWIGAGAQIASGIAIGKGATIAAGAVVTKDVKPRTLVAGNPARVLVVDYDNIALLQLPPGIVC